MNRLWGGARSMADLSGRAGGLCLAFLALAAMPAAAQVCGNPDVDPPAQSTNAPFVNPDVYSGLKTAADPLAIRLTGNVESAGAGACGRWFRRKMEISVAGRKLGFVQGRADRPLAAEKGSVELPVYLYFHYPKNAAPDADVVTTLNQYKIAAFKRPVSMRELSANVSVTGEGNFTVPVVADWLDTPEGLNIAFFACLPYCSNALLKDGRTVAATAVSRSPEPVAVAGANEDKPTDRRRAQAETPRGSRQASAETPAGRTQAATPPKPAGSVKVELLSVVSNAPAARLIVGHRISLAADCRDRDTVDTVALSPRASVTTLKIPDGIQDEACLVVISEAENLERCYPYLQSNLSNGASLVVHVLANMPQPACPEPRPWHVTFHEAGPDGKPEALPPGRVQDLSPDVRLAQKALVHRDGGFEVVLSRRDLEEITANPTGALEISSALSVLTVDLVRDRREVRVHVKNRTVSLADLSFEFWKGEGTAASAERNCVMALRIESRNRAGRWSGIGQGDVGLKHVQNAEYRANAAGADLGKAYVHLPESGAAFQIVNTDTDLETCYLEKPYVDVAEAAARKIKRTVGKPKAGFVAVVTADRALEGLSPAQQQQFAQFATELINRVGDLKNKKREGFGFSVVQGALGSQRARQLSQARAVALLDIDKSPLGEFLSKSSNWSDFRLDDAGNVVRQTLDDLQIQNRDAPVSILLVGPALDTRDVCRSGIKSLARQYGWLSETARQLMVVSIANGRAIDDAVSRRSLAAVDKSDLYNLFRCQPVKNEVEHIDYYVVQVPDVLRRDQSGPTVDYLADQAKRLFKMQ